MQRVKQAAKHARTTKVATVTALGTAGLGLSLTGASAHMILTADIPQSDNISRPISASFLAKRKWPTSVSQRFISSIRKTLAATCSSPLLLFAEVAVVAVAAAAALCAAVGAARVAAAAARAGDGAVGAKFHDLAASLPKGQ